ncbi:hypothetical protein PAEPH01_0530 [Pancytospora epiphaga]|nr:hypothetical protein PAEPH01_0530 [Pancytospora epiphaga]
MKYTEFNLLKLLEHGKLSLDKMYESIAGVLGLEFYSDINEHTSIYTICSEAFVLDITGPSCSLIFVDESRTKEFTIVETYLNTYLSIPPIFYNLLKFFVNSLDFSLEASTEVPADSELTQRDLFKYKTFCNCVITGNYCLKNKINRISPGYNIFTHRNETGLYNPITCTSVEDWSNIKITSNLSEYFTMDEYMANTVKKLPPSSQYHYSIDTIRVVNLDIYIEDERCKIASFIFRKGRNLAEAISISKEMKGKCHQIDIES